MPVSCDSLAQNFGDRATHLARWPPAPVTVSQPEARTVTAGRRSAPAVKTSWYPPPMATGQWNTPCGMIGSPQTSLAKARAFARSRTVMPGSFLGTGLACPS